ncbi:hypothetical protein [Paenibacillus ferrarius]|uniref:hypothetical protein n=1 Tax=Paenibacillus ferrarius TaxID=1469647 RepID=UPI003D285843
MFRQRSKVVVSILMSFILVAILYVLMNRFLILDRSELSFGIYDFFGKPPIEAVVEVEGTGSTKVRDRSVSTQVVIKKVVRQNEELKLQPGQVLEVHEYLDVMPTRYLYPFAPGRSIVGMGTSYHRIAKHEQRTVDLHVKDNTYSIVPNSLSQ